MKLLLIIAYILISSGISYKEANAGTLQCQSLFGKVTLKGKIKVSGSLKTDLDHTTIEYVLNGETIGWIQFHRYSKLNALYVIKMEVNEEYKSLGISKVLFKELIKFAKPGQVIGGEMAYDNFNVIIELLDKMKPKSASYKSIDDSKIIWAATQTPFAKALRSLGYTELVAASVKWYSANSPDNFMPDVYIYYGIPE